MIAQENAAIISYHRVGANTVNYRIRNRRVARSGGVFGAPKWAPTLEARSGMSTQCDWEMLRLGK